MFALFLSLHFALALSAPAPEPGRVPKVYNALITSSQNLQPSKAYPVYQPVLHDAFAYPFPSVYYSDYPSLYPLPNHAPAQPQPQLPPQPQPAGPPPDDAPQGKPSTESAPQPPEEPKLEDSDKPTPAPPLPPKTESPIPLNQFGLPPQVLPLGRLDPAYNGFTHVGSPFTYSYPGLRFYDPFDPFSVNPYLNLPPSPLYRPLPNTLSQNSVLQPQFSVPEAKGREEEAPKEQASNQPASPPSEPSDLNILNYASKDPSIPNVPPPPLPHSGTQSDGDNSDE